MPFIDSVEAQNICTFDQCDQKKIVQLSIKFAQNDFTRKMKYFDPFPKIA